MKRLLTETWFWPFHIMDMSRIAAKLVVIENFQEIERTLTETWLFTLRIMSGVLGQSILEE